MAERWTGELVRHAVTAVRFGRTWVRPEAVDAVEAHAGGTKLHLRGGGAVFLSARFDADSVAESLWGKSDG